MSYQVLARKWRPRNFQEIVGQDYILRILANALEQKRIHHAYLLTGTRGVGKTTLARLLAKCLNCELGVTASPCGTCPSCKEIDAGKFLDLYEIDAASRTKVEDIRELLDNVLYPPVKGRYKIYLIDEVHMLSHHSFNALLKTLEEPPDHVKFLLATTEPKRLPITILSRCLQFHLKRIDPAQIALHLQHICELEKVSFEKPALNQLAVSADGSMRDALSLLDQAIAYGQGTIKQSDINDMLGHVASDEILPLLEALAMRDGKSLFSAIAVLTSKAADFQQILEKLIQLLHQIALTQLLPDLNLACDITLSFTSRFLPEDLQLYYQIALLARRELALASSPQQGFEMTMLRMLTLSPHFQPVLKKKEDKDHLTQTYPVAPSMPLSNSASLVESSEPLLEWRELISKLELSGMAYALAANCTLEKVTAEVAELALSINHQPMLNPKLKNRIEEALSRYFHRPLTLNIKIITTELLTPSKQLEQDQHEKLSKAKETLLKNPQIEQFIEMYDATVEVSLLAITST